MKRRDPSSVGLACARMMLRWIAAASLATVALALISGPAAASNATVGQDTGGSSALSGVVMIAGALVALGLIGAAVVAAPHARTRLPRTRVTSWVAATSSGIEKSWKGIRQAGRALNQAERPPSAPARPADQREARARTRTRRGREAVPGGHRGADGGMGNAGRHDYGETGLDGSRLRSLSRSRITVDKWDNPFKHPDIEVAGRGFDDIGTSRNGSKVILEWKEEGESEDPGQLGDRWIGRKIAELEAVNDQKAQELLSDLNKGRLTSRTYTTKMVNGILDTRLTRTRYYKGDHIPGVLKEYSERLDHLKAHPDELQELSRGLPPDRRTRRVAVTRAAADAPNEAKTLERTGGQPERIARQSARSSDGDHSPSNEVTVPERQEVSPKGGTIS